MTVTTPKISSTCTPTFLGFMKPHSWMCFVSLFFLIFLFKSHITIRIPIEFLLSRFLTGSDGKWALFDRVRNQTVVCSFWRKVLVYSSFYVFRGFVQTLIQAIALNTMLYNHDLSVQCQTYYIHCNSRNPASKDSLGLADLLPSTPCCNL